MYSTDISSALQYFHQKRFPRVSAHLCVPAILPARMRHLRSRAALLGKRHGESATLIRRLGVMGGLELAVAAGWWKYNGKGLCMRGVECCSNNLGARRSSRRDAHVTSRASPQLCSGRDYGKSPAICLRRSECICIEGNKMQVRLGKVRCCLGVDAAARLGNGSKCFELAPLVDCDQGALEHCTGLNELPFAQPQRTIASRHSSFSSTGRHTGDTLLTLKDHHARAVSKTEEQLRHWETAYSGSQPTAVAESEREIIALSAVGALYL